MSIIERLATSLLYEGCILRPYRLSARADEQRWAVNGVFPRSYSEANDDANSWRQQTQVLVTGAAPVVSIQVRFLQLVERQIGRRNTDGSLTLVDALDADGVHYLAWEEAMEREIVLGPLAVADKNPSRRVPIQISAGSDEEPVLNTDGTLAGVVIRRWHALQGSIGVAAEPLAPDIYRLTVTVANTAPWSGQDRRTTLHRTLVSTHTVLTVEDGGFMSLLAPPEDVKPLAEACVNIKTWPVLVGEEGEHTVMLSSPIILHDYPQAVPESRDRYFDEGDVDPPLMLNIRAVSNAQTARSGQPFAGYAARSNEPSR